MTITELSLVLDRHVSRSPFLRTTCTALQYSRADFCISREEALPQSVQNVISDCDNHIGHLDPLIRLEVGRNLRLQISELVLRYVLLFDEDVHSVGCDKGM